MYRCRTDRVRPCQQVEFDDRGNNIKWNGSAFVQVEDKSHQWFGATVRSTGSEGLVVVSYIPYSNFTFVETI